MKNWKSSLFGILLGVSSAIVSGTIPTNAAIVKWTAAIQAMAGIALGVSVKDKDVTGVGKAARKTLESEKE